MEKGGQGVKGREGKRRTSQCISSRCQKRLIRLKKIHQNYCVLGDRERKREMERELYYPLEVVNARKKCKEREIERHTENA